MKRSYWLGALGTLLLVSACSNLKEPATRAVASADTSLAAIKDAAAKYAPDTLRSVEARIASLKDSLSTGDYKAVIAAAPSVTSALRPEQRREGEAGGD